MKNVCLPEYNLCCEQKRLNYCYLPVISVGLKTGELDLKVSTVKKKYRSIQYYLIVSVSIPVLPLVER